jgi:MinD-like ATPase involved in chromosome partitioning or flagellar assembly
MIIAFWSYKGGVGRTSMLANIAVQLTKQNYRVGCLDLDFEAPGLAESFNLEITNPDLTFLPLILNGGRPKEVERRIIKKKITPKNDIYFIPTISLPEILDQLKFDTAFSNALSNIINAFTEIKELDYILIDSRSGLSLTAAFVMSLSDKIVIVFRPDKQNITGINSMLLNPNIKSLNLYLAPSQVPDHKKSEELLKKVKEKINHKNRWLEPIYYNIDTALNDSIVSLDSPRKTISQIYSNISKEIR